VPDSRDHIDVVDNWMKQAANGLSSTELLRLFEKAMNAICERAYLTLGDVTLTAIVDRVLYNAAKEFPLFESVEPGTRGVALRELPKLENSGNEVELKEGIRFVLVEFFVVIGNLTGEILTPGLHSELSRVVFEDAEPGGGESEREAER
jgi:hypothetical protein